MAASASFLAVSVVGSSVLTAVTKVVSSVVTVVTEVVSSVLTVVAGTIAGELLPSRTARASTIVVISEVSVIGDRTRLYGSIELAAPACSYDTVAVADVSSKEAMQPEASPPEHAVFCCTAAVSRRYAKANSVVAGSTTGAVAGARIGLP